VERSSITCGVNGGVVKKKKEKGKNGKKGTKGTKEQRKK
jgi:hypothetical protein